MCASRHAHRLPATLHHHLSHSHTHIPSRGQRYLPLILSLLCIYQSIYMIAIHPPVRAFSRTLSFGLTEFGLWKLAERTLTGNDLVDIRICTLTPTDRFRRCGGSRDHHIGRTHQCHHAESASPDSPASLTPLLIDPVTTVQPCVMRILPGLMSQDTKDYAMRCT